MILLWMSDNQKDRPPYGCISYISATECYLGGGVRDRIAIPDPSGYISFAYDV